MISERSRLKILHLAVEAAPNLPGGKSVKDILDRVYTFERYVEGSPGSEGASPDAAARPEPGER